MVALKKLSLVLKLEQLQEKNASNSVHKMEGH